MTRRNDPIHPDSKRTAGAKAKSKELRQLRALKSSMHSKR